MSDILIKDAYLITMDKNRRVFKNGAVVIEEDKIAAVGKSEEIAKEYRAEKVINGKGTVAMPGLINCHFHLPQMLMRGIQDDVEVMNKLIRYIWPIQGNFDYKDAIAASKLAFLESIKSGTTSFISTGLHPRYGIDNILKALEKSGLRGVVSKYIMEKGSYATEKSIIHEGLLETKEDSIREALRLIRGWNKKANGRINIWLSPRSVGACSVETMREISELAKKHSVGITAHWAEAKNNVEYTKKEFGMNMVEYAEYVGLLGPNVVFAHGIFFEDGEIKELASTGTNICHCPVCNSKLAMGVAKVPAMLKAGVNVCLGTDGAPVNNTCDMFREMRYAILLHRTNSSNPLYPRSEDVLEMATINGAKALGLENEIGSIEVGKKADIILINLNTPHSVPVHDPVSAIVWTVTGSDVSSVIIDGKLVMENREVLTLDEEEILKEAQERSGLVVKKANVKVPKKWPVV